MTPARLHRLRLVGLAVASFLLMLGYSVARPAIESLFLDAHGQAGLPLVWLLVAVAAVAVAAGWSRLVAGGGLVRLFGRIAAASALLLGLLLLALAVDLPGAYHALYVWKDLYMVVLVETFYGFTNAAFPIRTARWAYGLCGFVGAVGAVVGNLGVGPLSAAFGSVGALWVVPALLLLLAVLAVPFARRAELGPAEEGESGRGRDGQAGPREALRVVRQSDYLLLVLALVALSQVVVTLVDYEFNGFAERVFPALDARTAAIGRVYAVVSAATLVLHGATGPTLRLVGVPATLLLVPLLLGGGVTAFVAAPTFAVVSALKVGGKSFDYTLFRAAKEMLYVPLSFAEKTRGKALVDLLTYRVSKAGTSLILLLLAAWQLDGAVPGLTLLLLAVWVVLGVRVARRFRRRASRAVEMHGDARPLAPTPPS